MSRKECTLNLCTVPGCDRHVHARGLCNPHYQRLRAHGDVRADIPIRDHGRDLCVVPGCGRPHYALDRCVKHYIRLCRRRRAAEAKLTQQEQPQP